MPPFDLRKVYACPLFIMVCYKLTYKVLVQLLEASTTTWYEAAKPLVGHPFQNYQEVLLIGGVISILHEHLSLVDFKVLL